MVVKRKSNLYHKSPMNEVNFVCGSLFVLYISISFGSQFYHIAIDEKSWLLIYS